MSYAETIDRLPQVTAKYESLVNALAHNGARCMWQITQKELEKIGLNNLQQVECWQLKDGRQITFRPGLRVMDGTIHPD